MNMREQFERAFNIHLVKKLNICRVAEYATFYNFFRCLFIFELNFRKLHLNRKTKTFNFPSNRR